MPAEFINIREKIYNLISQGFRVEKDFCDLVNKYNDNAEMLEQLYFLQEELEKESRMNRVMENANIGQRIEY